MRMLSRHILPILMAVLMVFSLAACGSQPSAAPSQVETVISSSEAAVEPAASEPAAQPEKIPETAESKEPELVCDGIVKVTQEDVDLSVRHAEGANGMVASASPIASKVGVSILEKGGNAVDAAVATAYALGMVEPNASGIGGDGYMLVYDANAKKCTFLDYKGEAPAGLTLEFFTNMKKQKGYKQEGCSAAIPGFVAGMEKANQLFGTMSMEELLAPTIDFAENGVPVTPFMAHVYVDYYDLLVRRPETERVFTSDGLPYSEGETFKNPEYAELLKRIAKEGKDVFYKGEVAQAIVDNLAKYGGVMSLEDLANFRVAVREPVSTNYRGYKVVSASPGAGGVAVIEALNMAEHFDVPSMGQNSPDAIHTMAEILKLSSVDRYHYIGDPDYNPETYDKMIYLTSKAYAAERVKKIREGYVLGKTRYGEISDDYEGEHTTHVSIIDKWGNMVAMTNTVSDYFGCGVTVDGYGFFMNNCASNFSTVYSANKPSPNKKVRSSISPSMIFNPDGSPLATLGTPGGSRIPGTVTQIISNIIDFGMDMQEAIDAPRIYQNYNDGLYMEGHMDPKTVYEMKLRGHHVIERGKYDYFFGGAQGVKIDTETGMLHGAADPRRDGKALGY